MKQHFSWAAVPAALFAFSVYGAATPAMAQPDHPSNGQADSHPAPKTADGATTFTRPNGWQAQADPDGMTNGGVDQPGGTGGTVGAQDGNNGSGNDTDCEDDNRGQGVPGHCKARSTPSQTPSVATKTQQAPDLSSTSATAPTTVAPASAAATKAAQPVAQPVARPVARPVALPAQVLGTSAVRPRTQPHLAVPGQVAGISASAEPTAGLLPNTGAGDLAPLGAAGVLLVAGGTGLLLRRRVVS